jgi:hypothetical protein
MLDVILNNSLLEVQKYFLPSTSLYFKKLSKTVEELNKQYSQTQDTCSPVEAGNDNSESNEDTDIQK